MYGDVGSGTIFAPVNEAFVAWDQDLVSSPGDNKMLDEILLYHISRNPIITITFLPLQAVTMENGQTVRFTRDQASPTNFGVAGVTNQADITPVAIDARNGVIHEIDTVLFPNF